MVDDTLSPVGFQRRQIKTALCGADRLALACLYADSDHDYEQALMRQVLSAGLTALGWSEQRRKLAYAEYSVQCLRQGETNAYGKE